MTGRRWGAEDAAAGLVDRALDEEALLPAAVEAATAMAGKAKPSMGRLKRSLYEPVLAAIAAVPDDLFS